MRRLLLPLLSLFAACAEDFGLPPLDPATSPGQIRVRIEPSHAQADFAARVRSLRLTSSAPGSPDVSAEAAASATEVVMTVAGGVRSVTVEGLDTAGQTIYRGDAESVSVPPGGVAEAAVVLDGLPIVGLVVTSGDTGPIEVGYTLADPEGDPCAILVEYLGGARGLFHGPATVASAASITGVLPGQRTLVWQSHADEPGETGVYALRLTPFDDPAMNPSRTGIAGSSSFFQADNSAPHDASIAIAGGKSHTRSREVELALSARATSFLRLAESVSDLDAASERPYATRVAFTLSPGDGRKRVFARFRGASGGETVDASASITLDTTPPGCHGDAASDPLACSSVSLYGGGTGTRDPAPTLALRSKGADYVQLAVNHDDFSRVSPGFFAATVAVDLRGPGGAPAQDGAYTVNALFTDQAGNSDLASFTFTLDRTAPEPPSALRYPVAGRRLQRTTVDFLWDPSPAAESEPLTYTLRVAPDPACSVAPIVVDGLTETTSSVSNLADGTWYWCVTAVDTAGNESSPLERSQFFIIDNTAPTLLPVSPSPTSDPRPTLRWVTSQPPGRYRVVLFGPTSLEFDAQTQVFRPPETAPLADGAYTWNVARYQDDASDLLGKFAAVDGAFEVDTVPPGAPSLVVPPDEALLASDTVEMVWTQANDAARYRLRVKPWGPGAPRAFVVDELVEAATDVARSLSDGTYVWTVTALDAAGNATDSPPARFQVDTLPPAAPVLQPFENGITREDRPRFLVNVFEPCEVKVRYARDSVTEEVASRAEAPGLVVLRPGEDLDDGTYTVRALASDRAGNVSHSAAMSLTVDTKAPAAPPLTSPADQSLLSSGSVTFMWDAASDLGSGGTYHLMVRSVALNLLFVDQEGLRQTSYTTNLPDGLYTWRVAAVDLAGNEQLSTERTLNIDTRPPQAPSLLAFPGDVRVRQPAFEVYTFEPGEIALRHWRDGAATDEVIAQSLGGRTLIPAARALADGLWHAQAAARDEAGNEALSQQIHFVVDTVPPSTPRPLSPPRGTALTSGAVTLAWSEATDPGRSLVSYEVELVLGGRPVQQKSATTSTLVNLGDGYYFWKVVAFDAAGNESTELAFSDFTVDTQPPAAPTLQSIVALDDAACVMPVPSTFSNVVTTRCARFTVSGVDPDPGTMILRLEHDGTTYESQSAWTGDLVEVDSGSDLVEGTWTATAIATDRAGNAKVSQPFDFRVDFGPPTTPALLSPADSAAQNVGEVLFRWGPATDSAPGTVRYQLVLSAGSAGPCVLPPMPVQFNELVDGLSELRVLPEGTWCWSVFAVDAAGRPGAPAPPRRVTVDTQRPAQPFVESPLGSMVVVARPTFRVGQIDSDAARLHLRLFNLTGTILADAITELTAPPPPFVEMQVGADMSDGATYSVDCYAEDRAGNPSLASQPISVRADLVPAPPSLVTALFEVPNQAGGGGPPLVISDPLAGDASTSIAYFNDLEPSIQINPSAEDDPYVQAYWITVLYEDGSTALGPLRAKAPGGYAEPFPLSLSNGRYRFRVVTTRDVGLDSPPAYATAKVHTGTVSLFHLYRGDPALRIWGAQASYRDVTPCNAGGRLVRVSWEYGFVVPNPLHPPIHRVRILRSPNAGAPTLFEVSTDPTFFDDCVQSDTWRWGLQVVDVAGNLSAAAETSLVVDALAPPPVDAVSPVGGWYKDPLTLIWSEPEAPDVAGYLVTLTTSVGTAANWACQSGFCSPETMCAFDRATCRSTWRCPASFLTREETCRGFDSTGAAQDAETICIFSTFENPCAGAHFVGWRCRPSAMGLLSCSYQMHIPASQTATPPLDLPYLIPESHYSWSPRAYDTAGNTANPGARGQFTIDREVPAVPILQSPAPGWRTNQLFPLFTWSNPGFESESDPTQTLQVCVPQGMGYQIAHSQSLGGAAWGGAATLVPNQVLPEGTLSWRVIVTDRAGNSAASAGDCAGSRSLILDRTPPRAPTIISPVNGSVVLANTPITWTREIGATGYRYYMWNQANGQWLNPGCGSVPDPGTGVVVTVTPCVSFPSGTTLIRVESIEQLDDGKNVSPLSDAVSVSRP